MEATGDEVQINIMKYPSVSSNLEFMSVWKIHPETKRDSRAVQNLFHRSLRKC